MRVITIKCLDTTDLRFTELRSFVIMDKRTKGNQNIKVCLCPLADIFRIFIVFSVLCLADGRIYNDPPYDWSYLEEDCQPFFYSNETGETWNKRIKDLVDGDSRLYGYVQPTRDNVYRGPLNCAIKVIAPPGYKLVVRIPRVEIYHDETECVHDYISVLGATNELKYCGFGTVTHSIHSTSNWLIFKILASEWDAQHDYIGFLLYYTAVRPGACDTEGENATEWRCPSMDWCTPAEVVCDTKDNCGAWDDERSNVCGLTQGAIVAISVVSILVGGTFMVFIGYCIYSHQKEKSTRERCQREIVPTVGFHANRGQVSITTSNGSFAEPPPPYVPTAFINTACNEGMDQSDNLHSSTDDSAINSGANTELPPVTSVSDNATVAGTLVNSRRHISEPPPAYTAVGFDPLPEKSDK